ncbi:hypothetical protein [Peribacillus kribbensis]|uniref:hypothetical protein n=1 Tax=Peribacillus kribbensis TaxID=356658 RepID=UPI00047C2B71|nr:hypothetical protein [Peribacillus kribbensis]
MDIFTLEILYDISSKAAQVGREMTKLTLEDGINIIYPQKVTSDREDDPDDFKLITFLESKILIGSYEGEERTKLKVIPIRDVKNLELDTTRFGASKLIISLKGEDIILDSNEDSSQFFRREYSQKIPEIFNYLYNKI